MNKFEKIIAMLIGVAALVVGCSSDADVVSNNISNDADNFKVVRRIVFYNGITDKYMLEIEGRCNIDTGDIKKLSVTCDLGGGKYKKHFLGLSDNVSYVVEQVDGSAQDPDHYKVNFKPEAIIPDIQKR